MIYLIRHGEAASSWGEHPDPGLSDAGHAQAKAAATNLSGLGLEHAVSSPMARCRETALAFAEVSGLTLSIETNVTEIPTPSAVVDRVPWLQNLMSGDWADAPQLVQTWRHHLIQTVSKLPPNTAVFTHFVAINAIVGHLEGTDAVTVFRPNYCSLTKLESKNSCLTLVERGLSLETRVL